MPLLILSIIVQISLVIHIMKSGRNSIWIWIVVGMPFVGSIAYIAVELLPAFLGSHKGQKAKKDLSKILNPEKDFNDAMNNYSMTNTVKNTQDLAQECLYKEMYTEAKELYTKALIGQYKYDPTLLLGLAQSSFGLQAFQEVKETLNTLMKQTPNYEKTVG
jgi:hypothetical protein